MDTNDLRERFDASEPALTLSPGSLDAVKARAGQRTRRARVAGGVAGTLLVALVGFGVLRALSVEDNLSTADTTELPGETTDVTVPTTEVSGDPIESTGWTSAGLLAETDFAYVGSFAAPESSEDEFGFGGRSIAFNPAGDGSLFITGFPINETVAEISIPELRPHDGARSGLVAAEVLQPFADVTQGRGTTFVGSPERGGNDDFRIGDLEVVDGPDGPRLHWTAWQAQNVGYNDVAGHGHSSLNLGDPDVQGPWYLGDFATYETAGYLFEVPDAFAGAVGGFELVSGFQSVVRTGDTSQGPPFFAYTPPVSADPETRLAAVELGNHPFGESESSSFGTQAVLPGGDWVSTDDDRHAIVLVGNSMPVDGNANCTLGSETDVAAHGPQVALYDPADLAAVAVGDVAASAIEPYTTFSLAADVIPACGAQLSGLTFDPATNRLFVSQILVTATAETYDARPVIHVFEVG